MRDDITVETGLFNHTEVKANFINPICFGENFIGWLSQRLSGLKNDGFELSQPIQEDYGWGLWVSKDKDTFWIALGMMGDGPTDEIPQWNVSVNYDAGLNVVKRLFHKPNSDSFSKIRNQIWNALKNSDGIKIITD
jgi:hypothetical protein